MSTFRDKEQIIMPKQAGRRGLDNRYDDLNGRIDLKRSDAINKNLPNPIPEFSQNATVGYMRKVTGKLGLKAIAKAAKQMRNN
jgi:hypothetical protein